MRSETAAQLAVDLVNAAVVGVVQGVDQRDDIEAEPALGQREGAFLLGLVRAAVEIAPGIHAAVDDQPQSQRSIEHSDGSAAMVATHSLPAHPRHSSSRGSSLTWEAALGRRRSLGTRASPIRGSDPPAYVETPLGSRKFCRPRKNAPWLVDRKEASTYPVYHDKN